MANKKDLSTALAKITNQPLKAKTRLPRKILLIAIDSELHKQLKILAAKNNTSMREICITALNRLIKNTTDSL